MTARSSPSLKHWFLASIALVLVVFITWSDALKGYFIADDAWHVPLVYRALDSNPELIWRQFISPYSFHDSLYLMYRPLTDISFAVDCIFWKGNAYGYHLQNLIWHAISASLVFLFSRSLLKFVVLRDVPETEYAPLIVWKIPLMVAMLFVVYPGHAEPVCWALPRIDLIGAAFTFLSLTCVLEFFERNSKKWIIAAIVSMIFGLLIKEMCAAIPLVAAVLYAISRPSTIEARKQPVFEFVKQLFLGAKKVWPMFIVLILYIAHRAWSLGSVLGGYQGTIGADLNSTMLARLCSIDALWRLFHPINENVLGDDCAQDILLRGIYLLLAVLILINWKTACAAVRQRGAGKLLLLLFVMVLPCIQIWGVTAGLIGARHAYTLCVPFILAIVVLIYPITAEKTRRTANLRRTATALVWATFVLFFSMSKIYAKAWSDATRQIDTMRAQIEEHASFLPKNKKLVIAGLPTGVKGYCAFYTIDFLPGLLMPPLSKHDIRSKVICIDGTPTNDYVINRSLLKSVFSDSAYDFLVWVQSQQRFVSMHIPISAEQLPPRELKVTALGEYVRHREVIDGTTFFGNKTAGKDVRSYMLSLDESVDPVDPMDYEVLEIKVSSKDGKVDASTGPLSDLFLNEENVIAPYSVNRNILNRRGRYAWLSWSGQINNRDDYALPIYFPVYSAPDVQTYKINLTQYKSWLFSGSSKSLRLDLPLAEGEFELHSAVLKQADDFIPRLTFTGHGELDTSGLTCTTSEDMEFSFDVSKIPGGKKTLIEVSVPYYEFHVQPHTYRQSTRSKNVSYSKELEGLSGQFSVPPDVVSKPSYYQIRVCALDANGDPIGSFSDPVTLSTVLLPLGGP